MKDADIKEQFEDWWDSKASYISDIFEELVKHTLGADRSDIEKFAKQIARNAFMNGALTAQKNIEQIRNDEKWEQWN